MCNLYRISFTAGPNQKYKFDSGVSFSNRTHAGDSITLTEVVVGAAKSFSCIVIVLWLASHSPVYKNYLLLILVLRDTRPRITVKFCHIDLTNRKQCFSASCFTS